MNTRDKIVDAAALLFQRDGYSSTTLEKVAKQADLHVQTLYRHFPTKARLGREISLDLFEASFAKRKSDTLSFWRDYAEKQAARRMRLFGDSHESKDDDGHFIDYMSYHQFDQQLSAAWFEITNAIRDRLAFALAADLKLDRYRDPLPMLIASMLVGGEWEATHEWARTGGHGDLVTAVNAVTDEVIRINKVLAEASAPALNAAGT